MNAPNIVGVPQPRPPQQQQQLRPDEYRLTIRQEPERAKVVLKGKEKDRKPIDPPPIVQLQVLNEYENSSISFLHNPYYFCCCSLYEGTRDQPKQPDNPSNGPVLNGSIVSSLHRLKDLNNSEGGYFVFGDLSAGVQGKFRLHFSLYEYRPSQNDVVFLKSVTSQAFEVASPKDWDGVKESTILSRSFADQGVRLRLRKESRNAASKRTFITQQPGGPPATPLRPLPSQTGSYGSHSSGNEGGEPAYKRQRSFPANSLALGYQGQITTSQAYGSSGAYAPVPGGTAAAQGYPAMASTPYGGAAPFNFQSNQYAQSYNPYSQGYSMPPGAYRGQQQPGEPFMSPFTPAGQVPAQQFKQEPGQQQQHPQQPQYGSQVAPYGYGAPAYQGYPGPSNYQGASGAGGPGSTQQPQGQQQPQQQQQQQQQQPQQQQAPSPYAYYGQPGGGAAPPQYASHSSASQRGRMSSPANTPHLPPIQRPGESESAAPGGQGSTAAPDPYSSR